MHPLEIGFAYPQDRKIMDGIRQETLQRVQLQSSDDHKGCKLWKARLVSIVRLMVSQIHEIFREGCLGGEYGIAHLHSFKLD